MQLYTYATQTENVDKYKKENTDKLSWAYTEVRNKKGKLHVIQRSPHKVVWTT